MAQSLGKTVWQLLINLIIHYPETQQSQSQVFTQVSWRCMYLQRHVLECLIVSLCIISKTWKQTKYLLTGEWINIPTTTTAVECWSAIKRNELVIYTTKWINLRLIMLIVKAQNATYCILFIWPWRTEKSLGRKKQSLQGVVYV